MTLLALKDFLCSVFWLNENIQGFQETDQEYEDQLGVHEHCWASMRSFPKNGYNEKDQCKYQPLNAVKDDIANPDIDKWRPKPLRVSSWFHSIHFNYT